MSRTREEPQYPYLLLKDVVLVPFAVLLGAIPRLVYPDSARIQFPFWEKRDSLIGWLELF